MASYQYHTEKKPKTASRLAQCSKSNRLARRRIWQLIAETRYGRVVAAERRAL